MMGTALDLCIVDMPLTKVPVYSFLSGFEQIPLELLISADRYCFASANRISANDGLAVDESGLNGGGVYLA